MGLQSQIITVTQLNTYIKSILEGDRILKNVFVQGEISNFKKHFASGHLYFTLKDKNAAISCVMFKGSGEKLPFRMEDGLKVILAGRVSIYDKTGNMQMYVNDAQPDGIGALTLAFEQLKTDLEKEGLFDISHKKEIPKFPKKIGILTSKTGAVLQDIINIISRRYPVTSLLLYPTSVQGENAPREIVQGLRYLDNEECDVIITGRGGGSLEDLWAFNTEIVARSIFEAKTPIISAVGHETDFTISDFAADLRAPTPSAAAELATPNQNEIKDFLMFSIKRQKIILDSYVEKSFVLVDSLREGRGFYKISDMVLNNMNTLNNLVLKIKKNISEIIRKDNEMYLKEVAKLETLSPLSVLSRGYTIVENKKGLVDSIDKTEINDTLQINLSDGIVSSKVLEIITRRTDGKTI